MSEPTLDPTSTPAPTLTPPVVLSYESVPPQQPRPKVWPMYVAFGCVFCAILGVQILLVMALCFAYLIGGTPQDRLLEEVTSLFTHPWMIAVAVCCNGLVLVGSTLIVKWLADRAETLRSRLCLTPVRCPLWAIPILSLGAVALSYLSENVLAYLPFKSQNLEVMAQAMRSAPPEQLLVLVLTIGIIAPIAEELFFRGLIQTRLVQRHGPFWGIAITGLLFGIMHMDFIHSTFATAMGFYLGFLTYRTRSIFPAIAAHILNNVFSVLGTAWLTEEMSDWGVYITLASSAVLLVGAVGLTLTSTPRPNRPIAPL